MKKIIYSLFAVLALCCNFVSCSDDDNDAAAPVGNPASAEAAVGTYTGTWTVTLDDQTFTTPGYITVASSETDFVASIDVKVDPVDFTINNKVNTQSVEGTTLANICYAGPTGTVFNFTNLSDGNGIGTNFSGSIIDGNATMMFSLSKKISRKNYTFNYRFVGKKN